MSLYNMIFGVNPFSDLLLAMLNLTRSDVGRFRDCYLSRDEDDGKSLRIVVYTRNGGGNRDDYESETEALRSLPTYIKDYDESFDCTYASYEFRVPDAFKALAEELMPNEAEASSMDRFKSLIEKLQVDDTPAAARVMLIGKSLLDRVEQEVKQAQASLSSNAKRENT